MDSRQKHSGMTDGARSELRSEIDQKVTLNFQPFKIKILNRSMGQAEKNKVAVEMNELTGNKELNHLLDLVQNPNWDHFKTSYKSDPSSFAGVLLGFPNRRTPAQVLGVVFGTSSGLKVITFAEGAEVVLPDVLLTMDRGLIINLNIKTDVEHLIVRPFILRDDENDSFFLQIKQSRSQAGKLKIKNPLGHSVQLRQEEGDKLLKYLLKEGQTFKIEFYYDGMPESIPGNVSLTNGEIEFNDGMHFTRNWNERYLLTDNGFLRYAYENSNGSSLIDRNIPVATAQDIIPDIDNLDRLSTDLNPDRSELRRAPILGKTRPELEPLFKAQVNKFTPDYVKRNRLLEPANTKAVALSPGELTVVLKREHLHPYDEATNPQGLNLWSWLEDYEREAKIATAGIRLTQNVLYPWDTRNRISEVGIAFATLAKALTVKELNPGKDLVKFAGGEVRYNTKHYVDLIARIQAAQGIRTIVPAGKESIPIWMASFLVFMFDLAGGEHGTSSHANSSFMATKDLNHQGSQYLPEESVQFVSKIQEIFAAAERNGAYEFKIAARDNPLINEELMERLNDGVGLYVEYLKKGVATEVNLDRIRKAGKDGEKIVIDNVGGSMYRMMPRIFGKLEINEAFEWFHAEEDPFFHGIGKELTADGKVNDYRRDQKQQVKINERNYQILITSTSG